MARFASPSRSRARAVASTQHAARTVAVDASSTASPSPSPSPKPTELRHFALFCAVIYAFALLVEHFGVLESTWSFVLNHGHRFYADRPLFIGWLTTLVFTVSCLYFSVLDLTSLGDRTKVQRDWYPSLADMWSAAWPQMVAYVGLNAIFSYIYPEPLALPRRAPSAWRLLAELSLMVVGGDFLMYWEHRIMHIVPFLRRHIHSVHHYYHAPFSWAGGIISPVEFVVVVVCQAATPVVTLLAFDYAIHPLSAWLFSSLWTVMLIEEHSGHDVLWAPHHWLPLAVGGGASPHDPHHYRPTTNFSFVLKVWDIIFLTYEPPPPTGAVDDIKALRVPRSWRTSYWEFDRDAKKEKKEVVKRTV